MMGGFTVALSHSAAPYTPHFLILFLLYLRDFRDAELCGSVG